MKSFTLLLLLTLLASCSNCQKDGRPKRVLCIESERLALVQFKHDLINGANRLASWNNTANIDCCRWSGIVCDNFTGHVQELHLQGPDPNVEEPATTQILAGKLNPSLLSLKQLKYLDLSCNDFGAIRIPSFLGSLQNLKHLNLSMSGFQGEVPHQLGNLSMLVVLDLKNAAWLGDVRIKSLAWLSGLPLLQHLDMSGYDLRSVSNWFQVINTLPSLVELHLSSCNLSQIPHQLSQVNFTSLTILDLSYNFFDSLMPRWIFTLNKLVSLDLSSCFLHGPVPVGSVGGFRNMTDLKFLDVPQNDFMNSSLVLKAVLSLTGLESLDISTCNISTSILADLHNMTSLTSLDLSRNQIMETLPNFFGNLCNLIYIDIRENYISGNISEIINSLCECKSPKLEHLGLSANLFSGYIPYRLGQLQNLVSLDLGFNYISGVIPDSLGRLSSLRELILNVNSLSGPIPDSVGNLTSLEWLEISFNHFNGSLPKSVGRLGKLTYLSVHRNSLTGVLTKDYFANLTSLKTLWANGNMLTLELGADKWVPPFQLDILRIGSWKLGPRFPSWLRSQRNLIQLDIADAGISDIVPSWFWISFPNIFFLNMSHNNIRGMLIEDLILAPNAVVDLSHNQFEGPLPGKFNEADFVLLDVSNNNLSGSLEKFLCPSLEIERQLQVLDLANNNLSGFIPDCWTNWQANLAVVSFESNNLSGGIPESVRNLSSLKSFNIRNNRLSGRLPASLLNLKSLQVLELAENDFTGNLPLMIGREETQLKLLSLRSNKLEGEIPDELCRLTSIQILDLAHNNLSGTLPTCFYNFSSMYKTRKRSAIVLYDEPFQVQLLGSASLVTKGREFTYSSILFLVTTLDLSGNKFSGPIPRELMGLLGLRWLNLSGNHLTGRIPEEVGKMTSLESLDLSMNQLDGSIPWSMSRLTPLSWLNLSYNKLTGEIPRSTQLQSFDESSFMANKLCGPPLAELCSKKRVPSTVSEGEENDDEMEWGFIISIVVGFIIGFWVVVAPLIASKVCRSAYFYFLYKVWFKSCIVCRKCFL